NIVPQVRDEINRPSNKLSRAGTYGVPVVSERRFLEWIGKAVPDSWHRTYSADQIAALSKLSSGTVNELVRFGLLDPREVVCSGFAIWQVLGRSQVCLRMGLDCLRSFAAYRRSGHGSRKPTCPICGCIPPVTTPLKSNSPRDEPISAASLCCPVSPPKQNADALFEQAQAAEEVGDVAEAERRCTIETAL